MSSIAEEDSVSRADMKLMAKLDKLPYPDIEPKTFAKTGGFYDKGRHISIFGMTNSGKSVLLQTLLRDFYEHGFKIIHRDDGGHDYLKLAEFVPMTVWYPEQCKFTCEHRNITIRPYNHEKPIDLVETLLASQREQFNVILFDTFVINWEMSATFWSGFLQGFIAHLMQLDVTEKSNIVLSIDEMNDLVQPAHFQLTEVHNEVRAMIELNIRKLRKHFVKFIATAHRPNQLTRNIRSEFTFAFVKQCCGGDLYNFLNHELIHVASPIFWRVLRDIKDLPPQFFYLFDKGGNFDKYVLPNLPEETPYRHCTGLLSLSDAQELKGWDRVRFWLKVMARGMVNQLSAGYMNYRNIAEMAGVDHTYIYEVLNKKLLSDLELRQEIEKIVTLKKKAVKAKLEAETI